MKPHRYLGLALLLGTASPLAAQTAPAGSAAFHMTMHLPDSLPMPIPIGDSIDIQMKMISDGHRIAMEITPNTSAPMLAGMQLKILYTLGGDTVHMGIVMPPAMLPAAGGSTGMRIDVPVSMLGAGNPALGKMLDSIGKTIADSVKKGLPRPTFRALGTSAVVAGLTCQEWEVVTAADTMRTCVIPMPPALSALREQFAAMTGVKRLMTQFPGLADMEKQAYGGRHLLPIRTVGTRMHMRMELTSFTAGVPDSAQMELPAGLKPMAMPAMPTKPGAGDH